MSDSDVKRDVDRILRAVHGAPKQKPATAKFDKEKFLRALNASLVEQFPRLTAPGQSALYIYRGELPLQRIARGMAAASKRAAVVIQLQSEDLDLRRGDGKQLLDPLLTGQTVILVHERSLPIGARLAAYWPKFVMNPTAYGAPLTEHVMLDSRLSIEKPGSVVVLQRESTHMSSRDITEWPLVEEDAASLAALADSWTGEVATIGRPPSARITFRTSEEAYRAYRALVRDIEAAGHDRAVAEKIGEQEACRPRPVYRPFASRPRTVPATSGALHGERSALSA